MHPENTHKCAKTPAGDAEPGGARARPFPSLHLPTHLFGREESTRFCSLARRTCDMPQRRWSEPVTLRGCSSARVRGPGEAARAARGAALSREEGAPRGPESRPLAVGSSHSCRVGPTALTRRRGLRLRLGRRRGAPPPRCPPAAVSSCPAEGLAAGSVAHPGHPPALLLPGDRVPVPGRSLRSHSASRPSRSIPAFPGPFPGAGV